MGLRAWRRRCEIERVVECEDELGYCLWRGRSLYDLRLALSTAYELGPKYGSWVDCKGQLPNGYSIPKLGEVADWDYWLDYTTPTVTLTERD